MLWVHEEDRIVQSLPPPVDAITGEQRPGWRQEPDGYELPSIQESPQPNIAGFIESQTPTIDKIINHLYGLGTYLKTDNLREAFKSGNLPGAITLWNQLRTSFTEVLTVEEVTGFQSDLATFSIPIALNEITLELQSIEG